MQFIRLDWSFLKFVAQEPVCDFQQCNGSSNFNAIALTALIYSIEIKRQTKLSQRSFTTIPIQLLRSKKRDTKKITFDFFPRQLATFGWFRSQNFLLKLRVGQVPITTSLASLYSSINKYVQNVG